MGAEELPDHFIPIPECEKILAEPLKVLTCCDGSDLSETGVEYTLSCLVQQDRRNTCKILHIFDDAKTCYNSGKYSKTTIQHDIEARLTAAVPKERGKLLMRVRNSGTPVSTQILEEADLQGCDFIVMGFLGRKRSGTGRAAAALDKLKRQDSMDVPISSNNLAIMGSAKASIIIMQKEITHETRNLLPYNRPGRFVVSVSLNAASTKAFIDALQLSKAGDVIDVVYVKSFMEKTESDYTKTLREKYDSFFSGLKGNTNSEQFVKFGDRTCNFLLLEKRRGKTTAQVVTDYAETNDADFIVVGTNTMRSARGKPVLGSVSADIIVETSCNIVVSHYQPK